MRRASQLSWIEDRYRRERAHRSWQAMQAVLAVACLDKAHQDARPNWKPSEFYTVALLRLDVVRNAF